MTNVRITNVRIFIIWMYILRTIYPVEIINAFYSHIRTFVMRTFNTLTFSN